MIVHSPLLCSNALKFTPEYYFKGLILFDLDKYIIRIIQMLLKTSLLLLIGMSSAFQCHECIGKASDISNPRLHKKWVDTVKVFSLNNEMDTICSKKEDLGDISTCQHSKTCAFIEIKETIGKY